MPDALTESALAGMEQRANAATPGPWVEGAGWVFFGGTYSDPTDALRNVCQDQASCAFIAHAREDVPQLVAEVRRRRAGWPDGRA